MKIFILPNSQHPTWEKYIRELAAIAQPQIHTISENPEEADIILITHENLMELSLYKFLKKYLDKCYALNTSDNPLFVLAGLYASGNKSCWFFHRHLIRGCPYIYSLYQGNPHRNKFIDFSQNIGLDKKYLFSFVGASSSWIRKRLFKLKFQRSDILIGCTNYYSHWRPDQLNREKIQKSYVDTILNSKFVLCPKGIGWGSIRLFEVMKLGVAPVIISDKWLAPMGPDWDSFALFIKQSEIKNKNLVEIIESHASEYEERGRLARKAWEEYFSDPVVFNQCMEAVKDLKANRIAILDRFIFYSYPLILGIHQLNNNIRRSIKSIILKLFNLFKLQFPYELVNKQ